MAKFSKIDYTFISTLLRRFSRGRPPDGRMRDTEYAIQETLERLVDSLCTLYREDNREFDENRFRMDSLGYLTVGKGVADQEEE